MDLKSKLKKEAEKAILNKAVGKILPMESAPQKKLGWKAAVAAGLAVVATVAAGLSQIIGG
jgi:hypothetical protein